MKIYITGIGVVSAIGLNVEENLKSLVAGKTGIEKSEKFGFMLGQVGLSDEELIEKLGLAGNNISRTTLLALIAAKEAWAGNQDHHSIRTGLLSATSAGGLDRMEKLYEAFKKEWDPALYQQMTHDNGETTNRMALELGITGFIGTISTACSSGANAIMQGARLLSTNRLDRVLVGGVDPITRYNIKGFNSLKIYDSELCKPFDENRNGLNLGEGAAFLTLENEKSLALSGNKPLCLLTGWNNSTDAFHQTASSPDGKGATLTMNKAIEKAGLDINEINYVNAHGTGTSNNDLSESMAIKNVFETVGIPAFGSTKGFTGHTLAAAGAIEAVYCVLSIMHQVVFPNLNFSNPMTETGFRPVNTGAKSKIENVLSNSFGFGGNCTSLVFSKNR